MSSFVVAVRGDGAPADQDILACLECHASITPLTSDGRTWIAARARLDARDSLERDLQLEGGAAGVASDEELILRAFQRWGERCVERLSGDFSFVIRTPAQLFAARDQLGVEMLYYARVDDGLVVANTIDAIRAHPRVSSALDEAAVADFLLVGHKTDTNATTFQEIRSVPPAHTLSWRAGDVIRLRRYWSFPIDEPRYQRDDDCIEELRHLVDQAIADRVRRRRAGILFSGGVDSSIVAAIASRHVSSRPDDLRGFTCTYRTLFQDDEPAHARAAAAHLGLRCDEYVMDGEHGWVDDLSADTPEPQFMIGAAAMKRCYRDMAAFGGIALVGEGPDNALGYEWQPYLRWLMRRGHWGRLARDAAAFLRHERRLPRLPVRQTRGVVDEEGAAIPPWMPGALVKRLDLVERMRYVMRPPQSDHPTRPIAYFSFSLPLWPQMFEAMTPPFIGSPLRFGHPFLDLRVLRFLMSVPVVPWCRDKYLLRRAYGRELTPVRTRTKAPLRGDPAYLKVMRDGMPIVVRSGRLETYALPAPCPVTDTNSALQVLRLAALSRWLEVSDASRRAAAAS